MKTKFIKSKLLLALVVAGIFTTSAWAQDIPGWLTDKMRSANKYDRLMAIGQLSENPADEATALLLDAAADSDDAVRAKAVWALADRMAYLKGSSGGNKIIPRLFEATKDKSAEIRKYATRGLVFAEERAAVPVLIGLMNDNDLTVRQQAYIALRIVSGVYIEDNRFNWEQWYKNKDNPAFFKRLEWFSQEIQDSLKKQRVFDIINNRDNWVSDTLPPLTDLELTRIGKIAYKELSNFALSNDWVHPEIFTVLKKIDPDKTTVLLKDALRQGKRVNVCAKWLGCQDKESYNLLLSNYGKGSQLNDYQIIVEISGYKELDKVIELWDKILASGELTNASVAVKQIGIRYAKGKTERDKIRPVFKKALFHQNPRVQEVAVNAVRDNKLADFSADLDSLIKDDNIEVSRLARQAIEEAKEWAK